MEMVNAAAMCQRAMQRIQEGLTLSVYLVYLDDVIILGESEGEVLNNVQLVRDRYQSAGFTLNPKPTAREMGDQSREPHTLWANWEKLS